VPPSGRSRDWPATLGAGTGANFPTTRARCAEAGQSGHRAQYKLGDPRAPRQAHSGEADVGTRTRDPRLTMAVLYQLSYVGTDGRS
jgi:hypothetical protein